MDCNGCNYRVLFCIFFDVSLFGSNNYQDMINDSGCPDTYYDIPETVFIQYNLTQSEIAPYKPPKNDNLWDGGSMSLRFVYQILLTYAVSALFTQPLILFLKLCWIYFKYKKNDGIIGEATLVLGQAGFDPTQDDRRFTITLQKLKSNSICNARK